MTARPSRKGKLALLTSAVLIVCVIAGLPVLVKQVLHKERGPYATIAEFAHAYGIPEHASYEPGPLPAPMKIAGDTYYGEGYFLVDGAIYYSEGISLVRVGDADKESFRILNADELSCRHCFAKDKGTVYLEGVRIDAKPESFQVFELSKENRKGELVYVQIAADADRIWAMNGGLVGDDKSSVVDMSTYASSTLVHAPLHPSLEGVWEVEYGADKYHTYVLGVPFVGFGPLQSLGGGFLEVAIFDYFKDMNSVYVTSFVEGYQTTRYIPEADPQSFVSIGTGPYMKDKNHVYCAGSLLKEADPGTFVELTEHNPKRTGGGGYAKDATYVYYDCKLIARADTATFRAIDADFAFDANRAFVREFFIPVVDPISFEPLGVNVCGLGTFVAKDKNGVYVGGVIGVHGGQRKSISGADPATFVRIGPDYSDSLEEKPYYFKDKNKTEYTCEDLGL